jgi:hypothetical protein
MNTISSFVIWNPIARQIGGAPAPPTPSATSNAERLGSQYGSQYVEHCTRPAQGWSDGTNLSDDVPDEVETPAQDDGVSGNATLAQQD